MKPFAYVDAADERQAVGALLPERQRTLPLAGGLDLLALMKDAIVAPERLVNVKRLDATIDTGDGGWRIGAAARVADLAAHASIRRLYPALASLAAEIGTPEIRHQGTVGGNLLQRPRCWYFRSEEFVCLKKGGSRCHAVEGENALHAIFGDGPCHIVHPSDLAVALVAYGARVRVVGPAGARVLDAGDLFQLPSVNLYGETALQPTEILTHVLLPAPPTTSASYSVRVRPSLEWPLALAAVGLAMDHDTVLSARIVLGGVAPVPWRAAAAERALVGQRITEVTAANAALAALAGAKALSGNAYKIQVARTAVKRALLKAAIPPLVPVR